MGAPTRLPIIAMPGPLGSPPTAARHQPPFGSPCRRLRFPPSPAQPSTIALASMWHQPSAAQTMPPCSLAAPVALAEAADANRKPASASRHACAPPLPPTPGNRLPAAIRAFSASERTRRPVGPSRTSRRPPYPAVETSIWTSILPSRQPPSLNWKLLAHSIQRQYQRNSVAFTLDLIVERFN